jgi:ubiquinone/menaquinone biosynthesis C-methylase UbiE
MAHKILQERYPELMRKLEFKEVDVEQSLPFENESFDIVILCAVAEHTIDLFGLMDETARVCRKGGCVVMTVPNICYIKHIKELVLGRVPITTSVENATISGWRHCGWDGGHLHYFSKKALSDLLRHVGFEPEEWGGSGRWAKLRRWYINFVGDLIVRARRK